jgi:hypothetical protein
MREGTDRLTLSRRQAEFGDRMDCKLVARCVNQSVCFYRVLAHVTVRWIVDINGRVLDWNVFHSSV